MNRQNDITTAAAEWHSTSNEMQRFTDDTVQCNVNQTFTGNTQDCEPLINTTTDSANGEVTVVQDIDFSLDTVPLPDNHAVSTVFTMPVLPSAKQSYRYIPQPAVGVSGATNIQSSDNCSQKQFVQMVDGDENRQLYTLTFNAEGKGMLHTIAQPYQTILTNQQTHGSDIVEAHSTPMTATNTIMDIVMNEDNTVNNTMNDTVNDTVAKSKTTEEQQTVFPIVKYGTGNQNLIFDNSSGSLCFASVSDLQMAPSTTQSIDQFVQPDANLQNNTTFTIQQNTDFNAVNQNAITLQLPKSDAGQTITTSVNSALIQRSTMDSTLDSDHLIAAATMANMDPIQEATFGMKGEADIERMLSSTSSSLMLPSVAMEIIQQRSQVTTDEEVDVQKPTEEPTRKSTRLAMQGNSKTEDQSLPYDVSELWCEDCQIAYTDGCKVHKIVMIEDRAILSRAWASLPVNLQIYRLNAEPNENSIGVYARKSIVARTQYGPFIAEVETDKQEAMKRSEEEKSLLLQIDKPSGSEWLKAEDENKCNWMMFIRCASHIGEQNLVAYQYGTDIYYSTTKPIAAKEELKVWYAGHYGKHIGAKCINDNDSVSENAAANNVWMCGDCNTPYDSMDALQLHVQQDHTELSPSQSLALIRKANQDNVNADKKSHRQKFKRKDVDNVPPQYQNWKKKMCMNRQRFHSVKKSIRSLYKRKGKDPSDSVWVCTHCDLTFHNASLLNLHTLTHAAEDVGLEEIIQRESSNTNLTDNSEELVNIQPTLDTTLGDYICPVCNATFTSKIELGQHASEHGVTKEERKAVQPSNKHQHKCKICSKTFLDAGRLRNHLLVHGEDKYKPLQCPHCPKRLTNNSALSCHLKTHSDKKYFSCIVCAEGFDQYARMKEHQEVHNENGSYNCTQCHKTYNSFGLLSNHMRMIHTKNKFQCPHCPTIMGRRDKLRLHMLKHTNVRNFMCDLCGKQFKRKDKLKEHAKRMHTPARELARKQQQAANQTKSQTRKLAPTRVPPSDFHRFIYKCHTCRLGFKRRGMLVNHLAKRHPDIKPETIPELNLPILKSTKNFYCHYCEKVYKSSAKRKAHILKYHPGADLPTHAQGENSLPFSQTVGCVTVLAQACAYCHKQYATRAKVLQHQRKAHPEILNDAMNEKHVVSTDELAYIGIQKIDDDSVIVDANPNMAESGQIVVHNTDILTEAMTELAHLTPATGIANKAIVLDNSWYQHVE